MKKHAVRRASARQNSASKPRFSTLFAFTLKLLFTLALVGGLTLVVTQPLKVDEHVMASRAMSLDKRYGNAWVNNVFKDNILLNFAYLRGDVSNSSGINWDEVQKPTTYDFTLEPGKVFTYHDDVLPQYAGKVVKTTHAHFNAQEGFKSDGYLMGDGVCHFASLLYWAAKDAGLSAYAPSNHDFAQIPQIPREYGVAIYSEPGATYANARQNLYITNNQNVPVTFRLAFDGHDLKVTVLTVKETKSTELAFKATSL